MKYIKQFNESLEQKGYDIFKKFRSHNEASYPCEYHFMEDPSKIVKMVNFDKGKLKKIQNLNWNPKFDINLKLDKSTKSDKSVLYNLSYDRYFYNIKTKKEEKKNKIPFIIEELSDDYYMVLLPDDDTEYPKSFGKPTARTSKILYKCDQWSGLISLLKDKNLII